MGTMAPVSNKRKQAKAFAFLQRVLRLRPTGRTSRWGENCEARAADWLEILEHPTQSLAFRAKLENFWFESDLLMEDEALKPNCRRLQVKVLSMENEFEALAFFSDTMFKSSPMSKLIKAIFQQAMDADADAIRIEFTGRPCQVSFLAAGHWGEAMGLPPNLGAPLRGATLRVEAAAATGISIYGSEKWPDLVEFQWESDAVLISLNGFRIESVMSIQST